MIQRLIPVLLACLVFVGICKAGNIGIDTIKKESAPARERISIDDGWQFMHYTGEPDKLIYDERPLVTNRNDNVVADTRASESNVAAASSNALKNWILPSGNDFIKDP